MFGVFNIRPFVCLGLEASKLKTRSYGATVLKSFIRAWCTYLPTYIEDLLLVDSGEAVEAESLLAVPGDFPSRLAGFTCLNAAAKKYGKCDLKKEKKKTETHSPVSFFISKRIFVQRMALCISTKNVGEIITQDRSQERLYFQDAIHWMKDSFS